MFTKNAGHPEAQKCTLREENSRNDLAQSCFTSHLRYKFGRILKCIPLIALLGVTVMLVIKDTPLDSAVMKSRPTGHESRLITEVIDMKHPSKNHGLRIQPKRNKRDQHFQI
eukprot:12125968-Ditylum_brightwellii.AAC.1